MNLKRVYRLYREEGLAVRRRKRKRVAVARAPQPAPTRINERWAMDFMSDVLVGGRRFRILNVLERLSREALASEAGCRAPPDLESLWGMPFRRGRTLLRTRSSASN